MRVADLVLHVNEARTPEGVQLALRQTMSDRSLTVLFWSPDVGCYVDVEGRRASDAETGTRRLALPVNHRAGGPLALVFADKSADHHRELLASALAASALGLENAALNASLLARLSEVRDSRSRIVTAGDAERRRLERDLHDGAQQHLIAIALKLRLVRDSVRDDPIEACTLLDSLQRDLHEAVEALRTLSHGIYPPLLSSAGLHDALVAAGARAGLLTEVDVSRGDRYPPQVEATVYFCCLEALQNASKHAGSAASATVSVWKDGSTLRFEVADDGVGFEDLGIVGRPTSQGLVNMSDRLSAMGGRLDVQAALGQGVRVSGIIPLE
jgi:signal transduction histidine kinase